MAPTTGPGAAAPGPCHFQGVPVAEIARLYGTPVFIYDSAALRSAWSALRGALDPRIDLLFSLKANPNISVCACLRALGAGAEVSSLAELTTALRAGVRPDDIIFLGPGKTDADLRACLDAGIHAVVCESLGELARLDRLAAERPPGPPARALLRINPDFQAKGSGLTMSGKPRQFGIDLEQARKARDLVAGLAHTRVAGVHAYMGTRFLDHADIVANTARILAMADTLAADLEIPLETVDFGGGLGVAYFDNETDPDPGALAAGLNELAAPFARAHPGCRLIMELGRYLTASCGTYMVKVISVKESMGEAFAVADGGTNHHMAAVGIGSFVKRNFPVAALTRPGQPADATYTVTGPLCTPNDVIARHVRLPRLEPGDLIGVAQSGAYGPTASPGLFLSHGYPAEVLVHEGRAHLVRLRDTAEDLLSRQRLVAF